MAVFSSTQNTAACWARVQREAEDVGGFGFELEAVVAVSPSRWNMCPLWGVFALRVN
jgi:hypothetical protein